MKQTILVETKKLPVILIPDVIYSNVFTFYGTASRGLKMHFIRPSEAEFGYKLNTDFLITSHNFLYLLISPRSPVNQGFVGISLSVDTSRIFLYLFIKYTSNVVKK